MTRTLPWKRANDTVRDRPRPSIGSTSGQDNVTRQIKLEVRSPPEDAFPPLPSSGSVKRQKRSGSTSPPPLPLSESFMIEGPDGDDRYRMVEDEFLSTAQQFTAHMHAAEYQRLKASSKTLNANTIRDISRPVVGNMTELVRLKQERKKRRAEQRLAIKRAARNSDQDTESGSSDNGDSNWDENTLHGLMASPRKKVRRLDAFVPPTMTTRASAGFDGANSRKPKNPVVPSPQPTFEKLPGFTPKMKERRPETTNNTVIDISDTDDDLDTPTRVFTSSSHPNSSKTTPSVGVSSSASKPQATGPTSSRSVVPVASSPLNPVRSLQCKRAPTETRNAKEEAESSSDSSDNGFLALFKKRRQSHKAQQEEKSKRRQSARASSTFETARSRSSTADQDVIPGFLG